MCFFFVFFEKSLTCLSPSQMMSNLLFQDYTKTIQQIFTKLGWTMSLHPKETPLTLGMNQVKGMDLGFNKKKKFFNFSRNTSQ